MYIHREGENEWGRQMDRMIESPSFRPRVHHSWKNKQRKDRYKNLREALSVGSNRQTDRIMTLVYMQTPLSYLHAE